MSSLDGIEAAPPISHLIFQRIEKPTKIFFYERIKDNMFGPEMKDVFIGDSPQDPVFACKEQEAAMLHMPQNAGKFRQIGVGDGRAYYQSLANCGVQPGQRIPVEQGRKILQDAFKAELEVARGHHEMPQYEYVHTPDGTVPDHIKSTFRR